jgi:hypothetical protein
MRKGENLETFVLRAHLRTPIIRRGFVTLDALLMATLGTGDVSHLVRCEEGLYFASAGFAVDATATQRASFVASMRPEHSPQWLEVVRSNTLDGDLKIGLSRQREGGNIISAYTATVAKAIEWYATGEAQSVLDVMHTVGFIGKRRTAGFGEVTHWETEPGDLDGLVGYGNEPLRPIPTERWTSGGDWVPVEAAWKAPYWDVRSRTRCFVPEAF